MSTSLDDLKQQLKRDLATDSQEEEDKMETHPLLRVVISGTAGILFGIALEKGRVFEPQVIRDQLLFKRFGMLKMFLSASAVGLLCFSFLSLIPQTCRRMDQALRNFICCLDKKSVASAVIGGAILGSGMAIAGACPGTVLVQLGAGVSNAFVTVAGGLFGAYLYAVTSDTAKSIFDRKKNYKVFTLDQYFDIPFFTLASPIAAVFALAVMGAEMYSPWYTEVDESLLGEGIMKAGAWPPFVTGLMVGTLQIPIVLANLDTLGSATSYVTVLSLIPSTLSKSGDAYLSKFRYGMDNWWQVIYVGGAVFGAYISATASNTFGTVVGLPWYQCFGGGMLMLYGSRLAGGCTSGHGLSGVGLLALLSFATVPAMFGGGIATALVMKYILGVNM